jgi:hypothetical protein
VLILSNRGPLWMSRAFAEDVYRIALAGQDFGVGLSYATGTSSAGAAHDNDIPNLGLDLDIMVNVLSQLEDAPNLIQPLQGARAQQPPHRFMLGSNSIV